VNPHGLGIQPRLVESDESFACRQAHRVGGDQGGGMSRDLLLAIAIPLLVLLSFSLALERWGNRLPSWMERLLGHSSRIWNIGICLIVALSLLRWLLNR
jgi:hypothetical protein